MNDRIVIDPRICDTFEMIQSDYDVTAEDIRACVGFRNK